MRKYCKIVLVVNKIIGIERDSVEGRDKRIIVLTSLLCSSNESISVSTLQNLEALKDLNVKLIAILGSCEPSARKRTLGWCC